MYVATIAESVVRPLQELTGNLNVEHDNVALIRCVVRTKYVLCRMVTMAYKNKVFPLLMSQSHCSESRHWAKGSSTKENTSRKRFRTV